MGSTLWGRWDLLVVSSGQAEGIAIYHDLESNALVLDFQAVAEFAAIDSANESRHSYSSALASRGTTLGLGSADIVQPDQATYHRASCTDRSGSQGRSGARKMLLPASMQPTSGPRYIGNW